MDLAAAVNVAFATLRLHDNVGSTNPLTDYRQSPVHKTLHTASIGVYDRWIVTFKERTPGVIQLTMRDTDTRRADYLAIDVHTESDVRAAIEAWQEKIAWWRWRLSVYRLQPGARYRVIQSFTDYYRNAFEQGTILTFVERHFLPYEGGHTIVFTDARLYLQENESAVILTDFDTYFEACGARAERQAEA